MFSGGALGTNLFNVNLYNCSNCNAEAYSGHCQKSTMKAFCNNNLNIFGKKLSYNKTAALDLQLSKIKDVNIFLLILRNFADHFFKKNTSGQTFLVYEQ